MDDKTKICKYRKCSNKFMPKRTWHDYCSPACRKNAWNERHNISDLKELSKRVERLEEKIDKEIK